jgi:hypothetical protein
VYPINVRTLINICHTCNCSAVFSFPILYLFVSSCVIVLSLNYKSTNNRHPYSQGSRDRCRSNLEMRQKLFETSRFTCYPAHGDARRSSLIIRHYTRKKILKTSMNGNFLILLVTCAFTLTYVLNIYMQYIFNPTCAYAQRTIDSLICLILREMTSARCSFAHFEQQLEDNAHFYMRMCMPDILLLSRRNKGEIRISK